MAAVGTPWNWGRGRFLNTGTEVDQKRKRKMGGYKWDD